MKIRVLIEQRAQPGAGRGHLRSGAIVDLENAWAVELLNRGDAEPMEAAPPAKKAAKRPAPPTRETR